MADAEASEGSKAEATEQILKPPEDEQPVAMEEEQSKGIFFNVLATLFISSHGESCVCASVFKGGKRCYVVVLSLLYICVLFVLAEAEEKATENGHQTEDVAPEGMYYDRLKGNAWVYWYF